MPCILSKFFKHNMGKKKDALSDILFAKYVKYLVYDFIVGAAGFSTQDSSEEFIVFLSESEPQTNAFTATSKSQPI